MSQPMTQKQTRILGAGLLLAALIVLWAFLPSLFPVRGSKSGFAIVKRPAITRLAVSYLLTGIGAGFGIALLVWPLQGGNHK